MPIEVEPATLCMIGFPLLLIRPGESKAPADKNWPTVELEDDSITSAPVNQGYGVKLGGAAGFIDIEGDGPEAEATWKILTQGIDIPSTCKWTSKRGTHRLFHVTDELREIIGEGVVKAGDLEFRLGQTDRYTHYSIIPGFANRKWVGDPTGVAELPLDLAKRIGGMQTDTDKLDHAPVDVDSDAPGSIYNEQMEWDTLLYAAGWRKMGSRKDGASDWTRPGKKHGLSATTGFCGDNLYVFTTSVDGLDGNGTYSKFAFLTFTQFDGDFQASASYLRKSGFVRPAEDIFDEVVPDFVGWTDYGEIGEPTEKDKAEIIDAIKQRHKEGWGKKGEPIETPVKKSDFHGIGAWLDEQPRTAQQDNDEEAQQLSVSTKDIMFPGFVEIFAKFHAKRAFHADERAGAVAGILLQSWLMGRKVMLADGTRPNIALLMLAPSGFGKTSAIGSISEVLDRIGKTGNLYRSFKSGEGMEDAVIDTPNMMYVQEEAQDLLEAITDPRASTHLKNIGSKVKDLLTASRGSYRTRSGADDVGTVIDQPALTMMLTGLPSAVWGAMSDRLLRDGFAGRMFPIELFDMAQRNRNPTTDQSLLGNLVGIAECWVGRTTETSDPPPSDGEITVGKIIPYIIPQTKDARELSAAYAVDTNDGNTQAANKRGDETAASVWSRSHELMCTLQLLIAGSANAVDPQITVETVDHAIMITDQLIAQKLSRIETRVMVDTVFDGQMSRVVRTLEKLEEKGKLKADWRVVYKNAHLTASQLNEVVANLVAAGTIKTDATFTPDGVRVLTKGKFICLAKNFKKIIDKTKNTK